MSIIKDKLQDNRLDTNFCRSTKEVSGYLRDVKDVPVLSDAPFHQIDVILTGDKDFSEAESERPLIYSPAMMLEYLKRQRIKVCCWIICKENVVK